MNKFYAVLLSEDVYPPSCCRARSPQTTVVHQWLRERYLDSAKQAGQCLGSLDVPRMKDLRWQAHAASAEVFQIAYQNFLSNAEAAVSA